MEIRKEILFVQLWFMITGILFSGTDTSREKTEDLR
jgi:hypothetical protein